MGLAHIPEDGCVYINLIKQAKDGNNLFFNRFTSEKHFPLYFNLFFFSLGKMAGFYGWSATYALHAARLISVFLTVYFFFYLFKFIFKDDLWAWYGLLLIVFSGGFGWLSLIFSDFPSLFASNYMAEGSLFYSLLTYPHFVFSIVFLTLSLFLFYLGWNRQNMFFILLGGLVALILGMIHIYDFVIIWAVVFVFSLISLSFKKSNIFYSVSSLVTVFLFTFPWAFINYRIVKKYFIYSKWYESFLHAPPPLDYVLSLGLVLIPVFVALVSLKDNKERLKTFLLVWIISHSAVMYFPLPFQRKLFEGLEVPVVILAVYGLKIIYDNYFPKEKKAAFLILFFFFSSLNSVWLPVRLIKELKENKDYYLSYQDWIAFKWMKNHLYSEEVILSSSSTAKFIPAILEKPVYAGHWSQTVDLYDKLQKSRRFYSGENTEEEALEFIKDANIKVVYLGEREKEIFKIDNLKYRFLDKVYDIGNVRIYNVETDPER